MIINHLGSLKRMIDHEGRVQMDNDLSLLDVTSLPDSIQSRDHDILGQDKAGGNDGFGLVASQGESPLCNINITLFQTYIKSKKTFFCKAQFHDLIPLNTLLISLSSIFRRCKKCINNDCSRTTRKGGYDALLKIII